MADPAMAAAVPERVSYGASGGRKTLFSFIFLLLLPFFASLGPMLYQRVSRGLWHDLPGFLLVASAFGLLMALVVLELIRSIRTSVEIGDKSVRMTLPAGLGLFPLLRYQTHDIPYDQIAMVETRREIYGGWLAPMLMKGARLTLKDGSYVRLGYVSESDIDPVVPYPDIARQIAARAGITVSHRGNVWRSARRKMLGIKSMDDGADRIDEAEIAALNRSHRRFVLSLAGVLFVLVAVGMVLDFTSHEGTPVARRPGLESVGPQPTATTSRVLVPQPGTAPQKK